MPNAYQSILDNSILLIKALTLSITIDSNTVYCAFIIDFPLDSNSVGVHAITLFFERYSFYPSVPSSTHSSERVPT